jgi:hypothetical protein
MGVAAWALAISIFAVVIASLSLAWQIVSWRRTGPVVIISWAKIAKWEPGDDIRTLRMAVRNKGRMNAQLLAASIIFTNFRPSLEGRQVYTDPPLPLILEAGHEIEFRNVRPPRIYHVDEFMEFESQNEELARRILNEWRPIVRVTLGSGQIITAPVDV